MTMAATLEAPKTRMKRAPKPWRPWRDVGVLAGIALAGLALALAQLIVS